MLKESSVIHIEGLSLTVRPNVKETQGKQSSIYMYICMYVIPNFVLFY